MDFHPTSHMVLSSSSGWNGFFKEIYRQHTPDLGLALAAASIDYSALYEVRMPFILF